MFSSAISKPDQSLLTEVAGGKMLGIEPREILNHLLQLQDRGLITMCADGWALTNDGKHALESLGKQSPNLGLTSLS